MENNSGVFRSNRNHAYVTINSINSIIIALIANAPLRAIPLQLEKRNHCKPRSLALLASIAHMDLLIRGSK